MKRFEVVPLIMMALLFVFSMGCEPDDPDDPWPPPNIDFGEVTDTRDGQTYKTIEIGAQTWMAQNLNYNTGNSWCYNNDPDNCNTYGRLYDWDTARSACPPGWHLPNDAEWTDLTDYLGGWQVAGGKMKSTTHWISPNTGATNESGWSGLPGGFRSYQGGFYELGNFGCLWSASELSALFVVTRRLDHYYSSVSRRFDYKGSGFSVRCLRDLR